MATVETHDFGNGDISERKPAREERKPMAIMTGGSIVEAIDGVAVMVLAILGLAGVVPQYMAFITTIIFGVALLMEGEAITARFSRLWSELEGRGVIGLGVGGGATAEFLGGAAGVVLGILSILGVVPLVLTSAAIIVFGAALLLSSGTVACLNSLAVVRVGPPEVLQRIPPEAGLAVPSGQLLIGLSAIILGILALVGIHPVSLALVALLSLGAGAVLNGMENGKTMSLQPR